MVTGARRLTTTAAFLTATLLSAVACGPDSESSPDGPGAGVSVSGAFVLDPLGAELLSVYAELTNRGGTADTLLTVRSSVGEIGSLHAMTSDQGLMTMRELEGIELPSGGTVRLEPGALHGMIEGLRRSPVAGDTIDVTFGFARGPERALRVPVRHPADARPDPPGVHAPPG